MNRTRVRWARVGAVAISVATALALPSMGGPVGAKPASQAASRTYVVRPGDTLWRIADRLVGSREDPRPMVDRLISLNGVRNGVILPGQRLTLP
jgi:Tfp pilus assembly protein FimV